MDSSRTLPLPKQRALFSSLTRLVFAFSTASFAALSGTVQLPSGKGLLGVAVSLRGSAILATLTDSAGRWSLGAASLRPRVSDDRALTSNLLLRGGRLVLSLNGVSPDGRASDRPESPLGFARASARETAVLDTLVFSLGSARATLPIGRMDSSGIVTTLDTATTCVATPPTGAVYFASPTGTGNTCSLAAPCDIGTATGKLKPGETAYLRGGRYPATGSSFYFNVSASGDPVKGWVTVAAYPCEVPFIDAGGVGVSGSYVRFDGLVSRNSAGGFGNQWTGGGTTNSNGHIEFLNCIADGNTRNGIAFYSAPGVHIKQCIVAHSGSSTTGSWSSGVNIFGAQGTYKDNVVESTVSFENVDMEHHSDGSGFIVDDIGTGTTFVNNIGFRNGGSCIRLTTSTNTHIINNTCYHDGQDPQAGSDPQYTEPKNPGEIFFSSGETWNEAVLLNNIAAASGWNGTQTAYINTGNIAVKPWNLGVDKNAATPFFAAPDGNHLDFHLTNGADSAIGKGSSTEAPATDIGFDPRCITKAPPTVDGAQSWWIYSVDYDYIKGIGGVANCFHPKARAGAPDLGAYAH